MQKQQADLPPISTRRLARVILASLFYVVCCWRIADIRQESSFGSTWICPDATDHLGGEYWNIAAALCSGRGFADPFGSETGPTAWMPPVFPGLMAGVYWLTGNDRDAVIFFVRALHAIAAFQSCIIILLTASRLKVEWLGHILSVAGLTFQFFWLFQMTHDAGLLLLMINFVWLGACFIVNSPHISTGQLVAWGGFGGFSALCSPIIGACWAVITTAILFPTARRRQHAGFVSALKPLVMAAVMSMIVVAPWAVRNRIVLQKWIPVKSNAMFQLWTVQCVNTDGVSDEKSLQGHPYVSNGFERKLYRDLGETRYIAQKKDLAFAAIANAPRDFLSRVANIWYVVCIYYQPRRGTEIELTKPTFLRRLVYPLPYMSAVLLLLCWRSVGSGGKIAVGIYLTYITPYLIFGFNPRYAAPLMMIHVMMLLYVFALRVKTTDPADPVVDEVV